MNKYKVHYRYGEYSGTEIVWANTEDEAVSLLWEDFQRRGLLTLSMATRFARAEAV